ncbi:MAG: TolC family protein [Candidatus Krumholzibacteria bacterium]|nr:TolC family protein [Candidatus Krumholzibacteria bacterium]
MNIFRILAVAGCLATVATAAAAQVVTMDEYLERVKTTNPYFHVEKMQKDIAQKESDRYLGRQDWRLNANGSINHVEPLQITPFDPDRVDVFVLGAGTERRFWGSGSPLTVDWQTDVTDQKIPGFSIPGPGPGGGIEIPIGPPTFYRNILSATWSLPLMQNSGGELDRLEYDLSLYDIDINDVTALENQENYLLDVGSTFIQWALAEEQIRIAEDRLDIATEELDRSERKRTAFLVDEVDVLRSRDALLGTQSALYLIESQWKTVQAELATLAEDGEIYQSKPQYDIYDLPGPPEIESFVDHVTHRTRLVRTLEFQLEQIVRLEQGYDDIKKPELALNLRAALLGGDEDFTGSFEMTNPDVGIGLVFSYPINNRTASADVEKTRLQIRQLELSIQNTQLSLEAAARTIIVRMRELRDVIDSNIEQISSNKKRTEEEIKLYTQGRNDLTFVIQSRDRVALSELEYAGNAAEYHQLLLQLRALSDELLATPPQNLDQ